MENKYFRSAGDLDEVSIGTKSTGDYFKPMGDLVDVGRKKDIDDSYFHSAGDLTPISTVQGKTDYFKPAGNLDKEINVKNISEENKINMIINKEDINDYLLTVTSGKKYPSVCELGVLMGSGRMIIGLNELMKMVEEGYNIVSANVINADRDMIEVEFQRYVYNEELMERRRRF